MSNHKLNQLRSKMRSAQNKLKRDLQRLEHEARHPMLEWKCTCGQTSKFRYPGYSVQKRCSRCGRTVVFQ